VRTFCLEHGSRRPQIAYGGWYDPTTGTFLTRDPLDGVSGTTTVANPYHYTNNDPINLTDPTGKRSCDVGFGVSLASCGGLPRSNHAGVAGLPMFDWPEFPEIPCIVVPISCLAGDQAVAARPNTFVRSTKPDLLVLPPFGNKDPDIYPDKGEAYFCMAAVLSWILAQASWKGADAMRGCVYAAIFTPISILASQYDSDPGRRNAQRHFSFAAAISFLAGEFGAWVALEAHEVAGNCASSVQSECDHDGAVDEWNNRWGVGYGTYLRNERDGGRFSFSNISSFFSGIVAKSKELSQNGTLNLTGVCEHVGDKPAKEC